MAYRDDIAALGPQHHWIFDGNSNDTIGTANGTNAGGVFTDAAIAEDATNCLTTNGTTDRVTLPDTADINNNNAERKLFCGWFMTTAIQLPPKRIYGEGTNLIAFHFVLAMGNNLMFEALDDAGGVQVFFDRVLQPNRAYHLCGSLEGTTFDDVVELHVDGIKQTLTEPADPMWVGTALDPRTVGEFGDPAGTVGIGGDVILLNAPVNGRYSHWVSFDGAPAQLTDTQIREELFEKGALPDATITTGTQAAMQIALNALASTVRPDAPLCIRVEDIAGGGNLDLSADNITFDALASIHVQWMGTGTLTWNNTNGSDASIVSTPNGGTVVLIESVTVSVLAQNVNTAAVIPGVRVFIEAAAGGPLTPGTVIMNDTTDGVGVASTAFAFAADQPVLGKVRKGVLSDPFKPTLFVGTITANGLSLTSLLIPDV